MNSPTNSVIKSTGTVRQQIIAWMRANAGDHRASEIYAGIGATQREALASASRTLSRMLACNDLVRVGRASANEGIYCLGKHVNAVAPHKRMPKMARVGIRAANTPRRKSVPVPSITSEDFIRAGGKIEVLPPVTYVAPAIQPVGWAA